MAIVVNKIYLYMEEDLSIIRAKKWNGLTKVGNFMNVDYLWIIYKSFSLKRLMISALIRELAYLDLVMVNIIHVEDISIDKE